MGRTPVGEQVEGQCVVVTAGASGIGRAMVDAFLEAGARVHVADLPGHGADLPDGVGFTGGDVSRPADVDRLFDDASASLGSVDVLCNNVGIAGPTGPIEEVDVDSWDETMAVNVRSMFLCCRRVVPLMREAGGGWWGDPQHLVDGRSGGLPVALALRRVEVGGGRPGCDAGDGAW